MHAVHTDKRRRARAERILCGGGHGTHRKIDIAEDGALGRQRGNRIIGSTGGRREVFD